MEIQPAFADPEHECRWNNTRREAHLAEMDRQRRSAIGIVPDPV